MRHACGDEERVTRAEVECFVPDHKFSRASRDKVKLILFVKRLIVGAAGCKENEFDSVLFKWLDVPDAFLPFFSCRKREFFQKFLWA